MARVNPGNQAAPRVVIDTSVLLPVLLYEKPESNWLATLWIDHRITPLANRETLSELRNKLEEKSAKLKLQQAKAFAAARMAKYEPWCEQTPVETNPANPRCEDPSDQKFIDLAIHGQAEVIITRDNKLLSTGDRTPFRIMNDSDFRAEVRTPD